ncbi:MAG: DNA-3-methyladenine glycosylase [Chloroflexota bacterium]
MSAGPSGRPPAVVDRSLLGGDTLAAARSLLGAHLVRDGLGPDGTTVVGRIVEVEAYIGRDDRASHARMGPTTRNLVMFGPPGFAYVYRVYGMHTCLNVVTGTDGYPAALLVRAVEPLTGLDAVRAAQASSSRRPAGTSPARPVPDHRLAAGPGLVGSALGIDRSHNGLDLCDARSPLRLEAAPEESAGLEIMAGPRVGISHAGEPWVSVPWRLALAGSPALSRPVR